MPIPLHMQATTTPKIRAAIEARDEAGTGDGALIVTPRPDFGTLGPGKVADIVAIEGDPAATLDAQQNVRFVISGGAIGQRGTCAPRPTEPVHRSDDP